MGKIHVAVIHILLKRGFGVFKIKCYAKINSFPKIISSPKNMMSKCISTAFSVTPSGFHPLKSTLHGGLDIQVTCPHPHPPAPRHTIHQVPKDLPANCSTLPDVSHLDVRASQQGVFVHSRRGILGQPRTELPPSGPRGFIRTTCLWESSISQRSPFPP